MEKSMLGIDDPETKGLDEIKAFISQTVVDREVKDGMKLGLGTGTTAIWAIRRIGELIGEGKLKNILAVASSLQTEIESQQVDIPLRRLADPEIEGELDLTIDGADEVDSHLYLTKGGGGALLMEKIIAYYSKKVIIVVDSSKKVENLGMRFPVPVEVIPQARVPVTRAIEKMGGVVKIRTALRKIGPVITEQGNIILDINFKEPVDPVKMEVEFNRIPGVVENGFFTRLKPIIYVGNIDKTIEILKTT